MTDLYDRLAAMLDAEPAAPFDLDRVVSSGRRSLRRRATLTAVVGTAGTAAVTAAIAIPVATAGSNGSNTSRVNVKLAASPSAAPKPRCELLVSRPGHDKGTVHLQVRQIKKHLGKSKRYTVHRYKKVGGTVIEVCAVPTS
jgi:hypothetical protein